MAGRPNPTPSGALDAPAPLSVAFNYYCRLPYPQGRVLVLL